MNGCWIAPRIVRSSLTCLTWFNWIRSRMAMIFSAWYSSLSSVDRRAKITRLKVPTPDQERERGNSFCIIWQTTVPFLYRSWWRVLPSVDTDRGASLVSSGDSADNCWCLPNVREKGRKQHYLLPHGMRDTLPFFLSLLSVWLFLFHSIL